jgi:predicted ATP-grasp superfamily ATP-dependent carboligase
VCGDLNLLRCFVDLDLPTVVAAWDPKEVTLRSRYCRQKVLIAPPAEPDRALADLVKLAQRFEQRPVLVYGTDAMLLLISRHRAELERHFRFRMPNPALIEQLVDKRLFAELAASSELPVPQTLSSDRITSARDIEERIGLPCIFKPTVHIGWFKARAEHRLTPHKALRARTTAELEKAFAELSLHCPAYVVQRYVPGGEENIYSYHAYLDAGSEPLGEFAGRKLRTYPKQAGVSTYLELVKEPELLALGASVAQKLGLTGPVKLDFKRAEDSGQFQLLEVNPRFTLWNYLGMACGVNLPELAYRDLLGHEPRPAGDYTTNVRWLSFGNDLRAFVRDYRRDGSLNTLEWLLSYRGRKVYDIWSWRDPLPFLANAVKFSGALSRRLLGSEDR